MYIHLLVLEEGIPLVGKGVVTGLREMQCFKASEGRL
jgi:hypothetical protein